MGIYPACYYQDARMLGMTDEGAEANVKRSEQISRALDLDEPERSETLEQIFEAKRRWISEATGV